MIKINDTLLDATLARSGDTLTISMTSGMTLDALAQLLNPGTAPEVRVMDADGMTTAIYRSHAITSLTVTGAGDARQVTATLKVAPIEQTEADKLGEQLARQADVIREHDAALCEVAGIAAEGQTLGGEAGDALIELAGMVDALMERVDALEALHAPSTTDTTTGGEVS